MKSQILLLSFFLNIYPETHFQDNLIIENTFFSQKKIEIQNTNLNGIIDINNSDSVDNTFTVENKNQSTAITIFGLLDQSDVFFLGLDNNNQIVASNEKNIRLLFQSTMFDQLYGNFITSYNPLEDNQLMTLNASPAIENTFFGTINNYLTNVTFLTNTFSINTNSIKTTEQSNSITINGNINTENLICNQKINTNQLTQLQTGSLICQNYTEKGNNPVIFYISILNLKDINANTITVKANLVENFSFPSNLKNVSSCVAFLSIDPIRDTIGIKNNLVECDTITANNLLGTETQNSVELHILKTFQKSLSAPPISIEGDNIVLNNFDIPAIDLYGFYKTFPNNTMTIEKTFFLAPNQINIGSLSCRYFWSSSEKLYFPKNIYAKSIDKIDTTGLDQFVFDINTGQCGNPPKPTLENIEEVKEFKLSKKEFLTSIEPLVAETDEKEIIQTICNQKINNSPICQMIIDYDEHGEAIHYDNEGLLAIASSQIATIEKEYHIYKEEMEKIKKELSLLLLYGINFIE
jgi:hypothetical protein